MKHPPRPTVIVRFDERGEVSYLVSDAHVRLLIIDERAPGDRVFEWTHRDGAKKVAAMIKGDAS